MYIPVSEQHYYSPLVKNTQIECHHLFIFFRLYLNRFSLNYIFLFLTTVVSSGKYTILNADAIGDLLLLVNSSYSEARLNAIKALTMLTEAPEGRKTLQSHIEEIIDRTVDPKSTAVCEAAKIAMKVIQWKP